MRPPRIFISYRRDDSAGHARAIGDELARRFGSDRVFIDVDDIGGGQPFADVIAQAVGGSEVLLALIGRRWFGERDGGPPRLADDDDFVRREIAAALARRMSIVPVLVDGAAMPDAARLPPSLRGLAAYQAVEIANTRYADDLQRLVATLHARLGESAAPRRRRLLAAGAALALAAAAGAAWFAWRAGGEPGIGGRWQADVSYDWPGARHLETLDLAVSGGELRGSASFLGVPRALLEGRVEGRRLSFVTRTSEFAGSATATPTHRYRGEVVGDEIRFVMQTEDALTPHAPVEFVARRAAPR